MILTINSTKHKKINCNDIVAITIFCARYLKNPALGYPL